MSRILLDIAKKHCSGKALFVLEGGYDLKGLTEFGKGGYYGIEKATPLSPRKNRGTISLYCSNDNGL